MSAMCHTHLRVETDLFSEEIFHHFSEVYDPFMLEVVDLSCVVVCMGTRNINKVHMLLIS